MLHIRLGKFTDDCIPDVSEYFNYFKQKSWFSDQFVRDVIYDIDKTVVIKDEYLESPVFGGMAPERLSSITHTN